MASGYNSLENLCMSLDLRANTAVDVLIGPFVDSTDGNTIEDGLTLAQADIRLSKNGQNMAKVIRRRKKRDEFKAGGCDLCSYNECLAALDFHHVDGDEKERAIAACSTVGQLKREVAKCIVVCATCHREIHAGLHPAHMIKGLYNRKHKLRGAGVDGVRPRVPYTFCGHRQRRI